jgi:PKD repeat protein
MRKSVFTIFFLTLWIAGITGNWIGINSSTPTPVKIKLISSTIDRSVVHITMDGFTLNEVLTPKGTAYSVRIGKATPILAEGTPDLPKLTTSLIIPDLAEMGIHVTSSTFTDYPNMEIAPSKGVLMRDTDPGKVPFHYGKSYSTNSFFPGLLSDTREPFIVRDLRGQTILVYPFQYNPVTKVLRVYHDLTIELIKVKENGFNPLVRTGDMRIGRDFSSVYAHEFLNFDALSYVPLADYGKMLVISYGSFMDAMQPYVKWKNSIGIPTEMIDVTAAGTTATAIQSYITNYYNTNGLTFVLLVGDAAQIPTNTGSGLGGPSDNAYGYIVGNDHYQDVYVGRFSAETVAHVQTQVQRTLDYERNPGLLTDDWYTTVIGIGSDQGPGDDGEYDYQHIRNQQTQDLAYTYTWNPELFDGSQGGNDATGNPSPALVSDAVNNGASLILYTGHGSMTSWGTTGFSNSNVNALTNQGKLPFIWSVACVNGQFNAGTCFAEAWMRATQGGQPTGAVAFLGSTINQSWNSPMEGQDEMTNILVETYPNNIRRTFAGLSINGCMKMIDSYGNDGQNMADTWTVFGDPTLMVRTDTPQSLTVTHDPTLFVGSTSLTVTCNVNGARVTATLNDDILATVLVVNNTAVLTFPGLQSPSDTVHVAVTAFNYIPYLSDIPVITPNGPYILFYNQSFNDTTGNNNHLVDYGEEILLTVFLKNVGVAATGNLNVHVNTSDSYVTMNDSTEGYGIISPNLVKKVQDAYLFQTSSHIPDGHVIPFSVTSIDGSTTWTSTFSATAHAPVLGLGAYVVVDSTGNNNGRLDPGETAFLKIYIHNSGSADAFNVIGHLVSINPYVSLVEEQFTYGDMTAGSTVCKVFEVIVDNAAPQGQTAPFLLEISADKGISGVGNINLIIGKIPVLIVDYDGNTNSGPAMKSSIESLGLFSDYASTAVPDTLEQYTSIFVCLGIYDQNHALSNTDGQKLADYLNTGGRLYMEGGDTWKFDPQTPVHPMFHISGLEDGSGDLGTITGISGTFTAGMSFTYTGDNQYVDRIVAVSPAFSVFKNESPSYYNAVAYDGGGFLTIGSSFEFGGLAEGTYPSTKMKLMEKYLNFFGIQPAPMLANFIGYPTVINPGSAVDFMDFSTGAVTSWAWTFPGGNPAMSAEKNPVITYSSTGNFDVQLIVSNGMTSDTLFKPGYIFVDYPTGTGTKVASLGCSVSPNPNSGRFNVSISSFNGDLVELSVLNMLGKPIYRESGVYVSEKASRFVDISNQPDGIYFLIIKGKDSTVTKKVILNK